MGCAEEAVLFAVGGDAHAAMTATLSAPLRFAIISAIILAGAGLRLGNMSNVAARTPDERVYTAQANVWNASGVAGLRALTASYLASADAKQYPMPTRVGMVRLVSFAINATGRSDASAGAWASCFASIASLAALAWIGVRFLPLPAALAALLFFAVFPAELAIARRTWADAAAEFFSLAVILCGCEIMRSPRNYWLYAAFGFCGAAGIAIKETSVLPYALFAFCVLLVLYLKERALADPLRFGAVATIVPALGVLWLGHEVGGLSSCISVIAGVPRANAQNAFAIEYASGAPYLLLYAFWIVSPALSAFAVLGMVNALTRRRDPVFWMALVTAVFLAIGMALPHWINLRYAAFVFGPVCLLAGLGAWWLTTLPALRNVSARGIIACFSIALIAFAANDYMRFRRFFVRDAAPDLAIRFLLDENRR